MEGVKVNGSRSGWEETEVNPRKETHDPKRTHA